MSINGFDTGLPSTRTIQTFVRDQQNIAIKAVTGDTLVGTIIWQDANALCIKDADGLDTILMRGAIAYIKTGS